MEPVYKELAVTNRDLVDLAVRAGRHYQSENTGFVHDAEQIPVYENALFALALLRTRSVDHVQEAKQLIERLLHFQNPEELSDAAGAFPRYLHEYPRCEHRLLGAQLLPVFYLMLRHFDKVLGQALHAKLTEAFEDLLENQMRTVLDVPPPGHLGFKLAAVCVAYGRWRENAELERYGEELRAENSGMGRLCQFSPAYLGDLVWAYEVLGEELPAEFADYLAASYHAATASYVGPALYEFYRQGEPQVQLYDFVMANIDSKLSVRAQRPRLVSLQAALVFPTNIALPAPCTQQGSYREQAWQIVQNDRCALSLIDRGSETNWAMSPGLAPFRLHWGSPTRVRSLVLQGGTAEVGHTLRDGELELTISLPGDFDPVDRNKSREILFYIDASQGPRVKVGDLSTNTFLPGQEVHFGEEGFPLSLRAEAVDESSAFTGHVMCANRPAEREDAQPGNDWCICLRTLSRSSDARIKVTVSIPALKAAQGAQHDSVATSTTGV